MPRSERDRNETGTRNPLSKKDIKKQMKQMREDIKLLQQQAREAEEGRVRAEQEKEALQAQLDEGNGPNLARNGRANATHHQDLTPLQRKQWESRARTAGARAAVLYEPFLDIEQLAGHQVQNKIDKILDNVRQAQEADDELEDAHNPALYWKTDHFCCPSWVDMSCEMIFHLPKSPRKMWLEDWFQDKVGDGIRKQRSAIVHSVATFYEKIFKIYNEDFKDRSLRPDMPEVQALQNFLHINEKDDDGNLILDSFFRDVIIVRVLRLLLFGQSAIQTGHRSAKARKSHAQQWHVKHITPSLLAFAATVIIFVLSGDSLFELGSGSMDYSAWYHARLRILKGFYEQFPDGYDDLMAYYNQEVFGINTQGIQDENQVDQGPEDENIGMDEDDLEFLDFIGA